MQTLFPRRPPPGGFRCGQCRGRGLVWVRNVIYPWWRLVYFVFSAIIIFGVFAFLQFTTFGMVVRAGMQDRENRWACSALTSNSVFTVVFGLAAVVAGVAGAMYTPVLPPDYHMGMDFLVLSFVVVVVGGMGVAGRRGAGWVPVGYPAKLCIDAGRSGAASRAFRKSLFIWSQ